jgi:hypothetical protein
VKKTIFVLISMLLLFNVAIGQFVVSTTPGVSNFDFKFSRKISTAIRLDYGNNFSSFRQNNLQTLTNSLYSFNIDLGIAGIQDVLIETKINYAYSKDTIPANIKEKYDTALSNNSFYGFGLSYINTSANNEISKPNLTSIFIIGPVDLEGWGYKFSNNQGIKFLTSDNISWFWIDYTTVENTYADNEYADITDLGTSVRFGNKYQSEISVQIYKGISIYGNASRLVVFPRTLFWKMTGSTIIFGIGGLALDYFTNKIKTSNPCFSPAVNFILKTGLNYGITELQKKKMNWPFNSVSPLMIDQYRVGLQLEF